MEAKREGEGRAWRGQRGIAEPGAGAGGRFIRKGKDGLTTYHGGTGVEVLAVLARGRQKNASRLHDKLCGNDAQAFLKRQMKP
jgi:hypothetical protein